MHGGRSFCKSRALPLGCPGSKIKDIELVLSHPQGLMQCTPYLEKLDVKKVSVENTAIAAERVAREKIMTQAAIASRRAAKLYGLDILDAGINFDKNNVTRFVILSKKDNIHRMQTRSVFLFLCFMRVEHFIIYCLISYIMI